MKKRTNTSVLFLKTELPFERALFRAALALLLVCASSYGYLVGISIFNTIARKEAVVESVRLETSVGMLEEQYFALSEEITPDTGSTFGLVPVAEKSYAYRPGAVGVVSTGSGL